jgi:MOSC domain-containing protein
MGMSTMRLAEIWRYPVKSMAGERLDAVELSPHGIPGDRVVQVYDARGRRLTARTHPGLLGFRAVLSPDGEPVVDGRPWAAPDVVAAVGKAVGQPVRLGRDESLERFDILPLLVVTDGIVRHLGVDRRRFRPNLFIEGVAGLAERDWEVVAPASRRGRCVMTTYDPDTLAQDHGVLRRIARELDGELGLDTTVVQAGRVAVGDPVELL